MHCTGKGKPVGYSPGLSVGQGTGSQISTRCKPVPATVYPPLQGVPAADVILIAQLGVEAISLSTQNFKCQIDFQKCTRKSDIIKV